MFNIKLLGKLARAASIAAAATLLLTACDKLQSAAQTARQGATNGQFHAVDITGANYAQDFKLLDQDGKERTMADFRGKLVVMFFGYTQCPDVCPTTLSELAAAKKLLGADGDKVQGIFVTVDPSRDTAELLKNYLASFDAGFIALIPESEQLASVAKDFKIYYKKVDGKTPTSYTMDHTAGSYVFDGAGHVRLFTRYGTGPQMLADDLKLLLK